MIRRSLLMFMASCVLVPMSALAHRMDSAFTIIDIKSNGDIGITHRIFAHDLEHTFDLFDADMGYFTTTEGANVLRDYIEECFYIKVEKKPLKLSYIGSETDGDLVYSYFESKISPNVKSLTINSKILHGIQAQQNNFVNIHKDGKTHTLTFREGEADKVVRFDK